MASQGIRSLFGRGAKIIPFALGILLAVSPRNEVLADETALLQAMVSEPHIVLMRHAIAPGTGDPGNFVLRDCSTQRNLSDEGRAQAARIGARLRDVGIESARVVSSQWCRCLETAKLLELGPVEELLPLNSFFRRSELRAGATRALKDWLSAQAIEETLVLVTHQVNISALTGVYPRSGEMIVLKRSGTNEFPVVGRIETE